MFCRAPHSGHDQSLIRKLALPFGLLALMQQPQTLSIATGGTGGVYYRLGGGFAEMIGRYIEGYDAVAEVTGASVENMGLIYWSFGIHKTPMSRFLWP